jgi:hypothetical protein
MGGKMKNKNDKKTIGKRIEIGILVLFIASAGVLTFLSQNNYNNRLTRVNTVHTEMLNIEHNLEYHGQLVIQNDMYKVKYNVSDYAGAFQGTQQVPEVEVSNLNPVFSYDSLHNLVWDYEEGDVYQGYMDSVIGSKYAYTNILEKPESWTDNQEYLIRVNYLGARKKYVIPSNCILHDDEKSADYVYIVTQEEKIWGTQYKLKRVDVSVVETNGEYSALTDWPGLDIVTEAKDSYYDGMLVGMTEVNTSDKTNK